MVQFTPVCTFHHRWPTDVYLPQAALHHLFWNSDLVSSQHRGIKAGLPCICCTCLATIFIPAPFVVKHFVEEQCFGEPANQSFMTSHLTDSRATGQRPDEQSRVFLCARDYKNHWAPRRSSLPRLRVHAFTCSTVCLQRVWSNRKEYHSIPTHWGAPFHWLAQRPQGKRDNTLFFLISPPLCCSMWVLYVFIDGEKKTKLIILVTLVFIYKHNLFLMKWWLMCGCMINKAWKETWRSWRNPPPPAEEPIMHGCHCFGGKRRKLKRCNQLTCWPVTNRMEPSLACTTCRKTWSKMRSSLQQFCSSFIWSSTWWRKKNTSGQTRETRGAVNVQEKGNSTKCTP